MEHSNRKFPVLQLRGALAPWPLDEDFRRDWSELLFSLSYRTPFCRLEWIETGISVYGENLQMVPCRFYDPEGVLQAIGLFSKVNESGRFLPHTVMRTIEYNSQRIFPLLARNVSLMAEALRTFRNSFGFHVDYYDFYKLDPMGKDLEQLAMDLGNMNLDCKLEVFNEQPQFNLDLTWDDYLARRTQGHRKKIRRYTRLLQEQYPDYRFTRLRTPGEFESYGLEKVLDTILDLYKRSWQSEYLSEHGNLALKMSDFYCRIARTFAPLGLLDICLLEADHTLLAYELNLVEEGSIFMLFGTYNQEYSQWSPGNAILSELIQDSIKRGYHLLEFGGEYLEYKKLWTKQFTNSYHLRLYGNTLHSKVKCLLKKKK